jgi:transcriptional regulator with XRE-family HTH domain
MDLPRFLKDFRKRKGLSYANFSKEFFDGELSPQTLKNLETGQGEPRISTLKIISEKLGIDLHQLAHSVFGLESPEEIGEIDEMVQEICDLATTLDKEGRQLLTSFARFIAWERGKDLQPASKDKKFRRNSRPSREVAEIASKREQKYIMEVLESLEEDWKRMMEEENPFA